MFKTPEDISVMLLYSAMVVYSLGFVFFAIDFANRTSDFTRTGGVRSKTLRIATSLTILAWVLHLASAILHGIEAKRVPWANMYEFALTATAAIVIVFLITQIVVDIRFLGTLITGITLLALGIAKLKYYVPIVPLQPALDSYWLVIHILVAILATGFLTMSFGLSILQLMQQRRETSLIEKAEGSKSSFWFSRIQNVPPAHRLEDIAYRLAIIGFVFWSFTLIAGAIWAERAWGRYWGWDTKEVWTFIIWVLYAGYLHARSTRGWRGARSAWLCIIAYGAVIFNFTIVNVYFKGLHAYSGL